jgi:hypothetical protein
MIRRQAKALTDGVYGELGATELRVALSRLAGTISIHFTTVEESLYPRLQRTANVAVTATARRFHDTLGSIMRSFSSYFESWKGFGAIEKDRARFAAETRDLVDALVRRLDDEDSQLYVLVDALPAA